MFPTGRKAAERKPMRVLRRLVGADGDAAKLLGHALQVARRRVVVKRPLRAPALGGTPTTTHKGKALRYDVYAIG
jgi:16S rRNA (guanine1516-N2)-methyltransferase